MGEYIELRISAAGDLPEILIAELSSIGFESFAEAPKELHAYVNSESYQKGLVNDILKRYGITDAQVSRVMPRNWNEEWESNFQPIYIGDRCIVRADFHAAHSDIEHEIIINPKMSFGTGHHQTTWLMLKWMLGNPCTDLTVLDAGCGTGVLSILAARQGAKEVVAIDVDDWACRNAQENVELNNQPAIKILRGTVRQTPPKPPFDLILANIQKNVLQDEMKEYVMRLKKGGRIVMSGFFVSDQKELVANAGKEGLILEGSSHKDNWSCSVFHLG